jgi:hypothetical protein
MKKDTKAWAIKLRGRSFYRNLSTGMPHLYGTKNEASAASPIVNNSGDIKAEPVRVRVRIEEIE